MAEALHGSPYPRKGCVPPVPNLVKLAPINREISRSGQIKESHLDLIQDPRGIDINQPSHVIPLKVSSSYLPAGDSTRKR